MKRYVLALDQGTTNSRAVLVDSESRIISKAKYEFPQIYPKPGWVEHDPMVILKSEIAAMQRVVEESGVQVSDIAGLGITNQRETTVVWDKLTGKPVYNAIVWQCRRTADICLKLEKDGLKDYIREKTGLLIDPYFSATKIKWILDNVDGARERANSGELLFGTIDTWLIWNLTKGRTHITDYSNASRTMLFDITRLEWDEKLCRLLDVPMNMLPEVKPSSCIYGTVAGGISGIEKLAGIPIASSRKKVFASEQLKFIHIKRRKLLRPHVHKSFVFYEIKKIAVLNQAALILVIFVLFQWYSTKDANIYMSSSDIYYRHYMVMLTGKLTPEKVSFINSEKQKFEKVMVQKNNLQKKYSSGEITFSELNNENQHYEEILSAEDSFNQVYDRYLYIKAHPGTQFVYDSGYNLMFGISDKSNGVNSGIRLLIAMILCFCGVFSIEYRTDMYKILGTTQYGSKATIIAKIAVSTVIVMLLFVCSYVPDFILISNTYGFSSLFAPLVSLPYFSEFNIGIPIIGYIIMLYISRFLVCFAVMLLILTLSYIIKNNVYAAIASIALFVLPLIINVFGIHLLDNISLLPLITTNVYFLGTQSIIISIAQICSLIIFAVLGLTLLNKRFCKN